MFGLKTAKDLLLEEKERTIALLTVERNEARASLAAATAELAAALKRVEKLEAEKGEREKTRRSSSRFAGDRCRELSARSFFNAGLRDPKRNLVAEKPPPGAFVPSTGQGATNGKA